ncbi:MULTISPECIES: 5'/3'-nucleotidase SurE [Haloarcula]|uniref:5'-nucleotidase SurE n=1 Tax=Haloarcula pellucida TaxID=1427151 RepID=A0A830GJ02_9EURY|nr:MULTISPECIES: 5'/3'-nucleotidase SurE [Halomicroarcula]MBX0348853.1 5'/3'-nucleotidase SurE [Halomicroarcula pellucida]MDS0278616.1 5'/3'-nucleotidase SurE [Halomicroarcula sp. S1AR25-4]GGN91522.1 5'/3'-nucleotidase SurE [Halomicroarcula pellucida]
MDEPRVLLTNDDGIDAPGLASLYEELTAVADVTVVAPAENQSGVGRTRSHRTARESHPWGYALDGTPADCVAYGLRGLDASFDLVVSGCNHGPNAGNYVVGRSGTVGACVEAGFLGVPGVAVSAYHCKDFFVSPPEAYDFDRPARIATEIVVRALSGGVFETADFLNVNVPVDVTDPAMRPTEPSHDYDLQVEHDTDSPVDEQANTGTEGDIALRDVVWPDTVGWENPFANDTDLGERYPVGTDRRALVDGEVSVSPLTAPAVGVQSTALETLVAGFNESEAARKRANNEE